MQKTLTTILFCFILTQTFAQTQRKLTTNFLIQYNNTIYDRTIGNNPWGAGMGLQTFFNSKTKFKPTIELTGDVYLEDDKLLQLTGDEKPINDDLGGIMNIFLGSSYQLTRGTYLSFTGGPSFSNGRILLGIKPAFGFYFSGRQKVTGKVSFTNIFNREELTNADFGTINLAFGVKLF